VERHARGQSRARHSDKAAPVSRDSEVERSETEAGAGDGLRTRYLDLGKVALYQVSYSRSDRGSILPVWARPAIHAVTGRTHGVGGRPHRSRRAFTRRADS
jgi:hypothetical protein